MGCVCAWVGGMSHVPPNPQLPECRALIAALCAQGRGGDGSLHGFLFCKDLQNRKSLEGAAGIRSCLRLLLLLLQCGSEEREGCTALLPGL